MSFTADAQTVSAGRRAILVGVTNRDTPEEVLQEYLDELAFLADTAGVEAVGTVTQKLEHPHPATFIGKGKLEEVAELRDLHDADTVIFDDELSPSQLRNVEKFLKTNCLDRTGLILQIFSDRAQTAQSKTQVELARLEYELPRLRRRWTHLERQRGGTGSRSGAGEQEIETDRRMIRNRIARLKDQLEKIDKQAQTRRKHRQEMARCALVGYTNAGKSTLMNRLAKADVFAENKLFATLDTTVRKVVYGNTPFLLSDTVGFIRKLPHALVESFKSTLDEVREADILVHVVDISNPGFLEQLRTVHQTLQELGATNKTLLHVFNKADQVAEEEREDLEDTFLIEDPTPGVFVSALTGENFTALREMLLTLVNDHYRNSRSQLASA